MLKKIKRFLKSLIKDDGIKPQKAEKSSLLESKMKIVELKREHKDIFVINIKGLEFVFRPLTKFEYFEYILNNPGVKDVCLAEKIAEICVLYPKEYNFKDPDYAGIPDVLFEEIKEVSGFTNNELLKAKASEYRSIIANDFDKQMENIIMTAFPYVTLEEIRGWDMYKLLDYFTRAEWIIQNLMPMHQLPHQQRDEAQEPQSRGSSFFGKR